MPVILVIQDARDQEDHSSKIACKNSSQDRILEKPLTKKIGLVEWLKV
jgi:hypothetical protein